MYTLETSIEQDPRVYHEFVALLKKQGAWTDSIVGKLNNCFESYSTITTTRSSERNTRTKVKMRIGQEFEVSQDCVPELLITIQYVDQVYNNNDNKLHTHTPILQNQSTRTKVVESQQPTINNPTAETRKTQGN